MTYNQLKKQVMEFVDQAKVNLGRSGTSTRQKFLDDLSVILDSYDEENTSDKPEKQKDIKVLKPNAKSKRLMTGKGVAAMTGSESQRADEEMGRSPFS